MTRLLCKLFGHRDVTVEAAAYGYNPMKPAPPKYLEDYQIRSRWKCNRCGHLEDNMPAPGEPWVSVLRKDSP